MSFTIHICMNASTLAITTCTYPYLKFYDTHRVLYLYFNMDYAYKASHSPYVRLDTDKVLGHRIRIRFFLMQFSPRDSFIILFSLAALRSEVRTIKLYNRTKNLVSCLIGSLNTAESEVSYSSGRKAALSSGSASVVGHSASFTKLSRQRCTLVSIKIRQNKDK